MQGTRARKARKHVIHEVCRVREYVGYVIRQKAKNAFKTKRLKVTYFPICEATAV